MWIDKRFAISTKIVNLWRMNWIVVSKMFYKYGMRSRKMTKTFVYAPKCQSFGIGIVLGDMMACVKDSNFKKYLK